MHIRCVFSLLGVLYVPTLMAVQTDWRPIDPLPVTTLSFQSHIPPPHDECTLYKVILDQDTLQQYIQYKSQIPDLKEFTLCTWHKFYNHSHDQPLFSYASHGRPKEIYSWVANTEKSSFYALAVRGQTIYRLNYPIRLHRWYHLCQSWNGRTGEWQVWINAERIGRGFHNLLVGKPIKGGGVAISGQEQRRYYNTGFDSFTRPSSLLGEIVLVQLYKAALTAGKAYTNHKHHHVHHFHHDDSLGTDDPEGPGGFGGEQPAEGENQGTEFPFLRNGQLIPTLPVHELSAFRAQEDALKQQNDDISNIGINSQLNILSPALLGRGTNPYSLPSTRLFKREQSKRLGNIGKRLVRIKKSDNSEEEQSEEAEITTQLSIQITEDTGNTTQTQHNSQMRSETGNASHNNDKAVSKRETKTKSEPDEKVQKKRTIQLSDPFGYIPGIDLSGLVSGEGYILGGGGLKFDETENNAEHPLEGENKQMEPAEWEVRSIMAVCSGCSEDPFRKANILSWRETPKKLYSGALYVPAIPQCHRF